MTKDEVLAKYADELKRLHESPETVVESTWRGLLAQFAFELAAAREEAAA